jgi:membrane protein
MGVVLAFLAMSAIVSLPAMLTSLGSASEMEWVFSIAKWPLLFILVSLAISIIYRYGPSRDHAQWRWLSWGSVVAAAAWLALSLAFSWYADNFGRFNQTYGSLGAAVGFMTWIWLSSAVLLIGAELNAEVEHQTLVDTTIGPPQPMGQRDAEMADTVGSSSD